MSAARRRMRAPQMLSVSKQSSAPYPQTRTGANVFTRYREQRRRRIVAFVIATAVLLAGGVALWYVAWPR